MYEVYEQGDNRIHTAPVRKLYNVYRGVATHSDYTESVLVVQATGGTTTSRGIPNWKRRGSSRCGMARVHPWKSASSLLTNSPKRFAT